MPGRRRKLPLVEVVWLDAVTVAGPVEIADVATGVVLAERHTTGYLIAQTKDAITVAQTFDPDDGEVADVTIIPAPWVIRRRRR